MLVGFVSSWMVIEEEVCHADSKRLRRFPKVGCLVGVLILLFGHSGLDPES